MYMTWSATNDAEILQFISLLVYSTCNEQNNDIDNAMNFNNPSLILCDLDGIYDK